jgi:hypothetical protein
MNARENVFMYVTAEPWKATQLLDAYRDEVLREAAADIRADLDRQGANGQYAMGMKRAAFLTSPDTY